MICPHCGKDVDKKKYKADFKVKAVGKNDVKLSFATKEDADEYKRRAGL